MTAAREHDDLTPSLVVRLRAGEADAGALLDRLYRDAVVRFARGYLRDEQEAEDAAQDVFAKVLASDAVPERFRVWLYRVARNHCLNLLRARARRRDDASLPSRADPTAALTGQLTRLVGLEDRAQVARALDALGEDQREVLRLRYADGLSRAEIAEVLELPESVVKSRLYEGLRRLRR